MDVEVISSPPATLGADERKLAQLGYRQTFPRILGAFESFATGFNAIAVCSYINVVWYIAMFDGGPKAAVINFLVIGVTAMSTALVLSEICSAMPASGSIFYWSAKLGGARYGPFLSWLTAWLNFCGWIALTASSVQSFAVTVISLAQLYHPNFSNTADMQCTLAIACTLLCWVLNVVNEQTLKYLLSSSAVILLVEYLIIMVWLPSSTESFQSAHSIFNTFYNFTGSTDGLAWCVGVLFPAYFFTGYEAAAHVAEETQRADDRAANSIWRTVLAVFVLGYSQVLMMMFCTPSFDDVLNSVYPQVSTTLYLDTIGKKGTALLLVLQIITIFSSSTVAVTFCSRVAYTIARDSVLPFSHLWVRMSAQKMPINAVALVSILICALELTILGSTTAFFSIISVSSVALNASYVIPIFGRLFLCEKFTPGPFSLGFMVYPLSAIAILSTSFQVVVFCLPTIYPVNSQNMNYASVMLAGVCILAFWGWIVSGATIWFVGPKSQFTNEELRRLGLHAYGESTYKDIISYEDKPVDDDDDTRL